MKFLKSFFQSGNRLPTKESIEEMAAKRDINGLIDASRYAPNYVNQQRAGKARWSIDTTIINRSKDAFDTLIDVLAGTSLDRIDPNITEILLDTITLWAESPLGHRLDTQKAREFLIKIPNDKKLKSLINAFSSKHEEIVSVAVIVLGEMKADQAIEPLISLLHQKEDSNVIRALEKIGDRRAVEPLISCLNDPERSEHFFSVVYALVNFGDKRAIEPLRKAFQPFLLNPRYFDKNTPEFRLGDPAPRNAGSIARALLELGDESALDMLLKAIENKNWRLRAEVVEAMGRAKNMKAVEPLIGLLNDPDEKVQENAISALAWIGDKRALDALNSLQRKNIPGLNDKIKRAIEHATLIKEIQSKPVSEATTSFKSRKITSKDLIVSLKELPIVSSGSVPKSIHPNHGEHEGMDYVDSAAIERILANKQPFLIHNHHIEWYYRGGGIETTYSIYQIAEGTWRLVEVSSYTD